MPANYAPRYTPKLVVAITLAAAVGIPIAIFGAITGATPLLKPATLDALLPSATPAARTAAKIAGMALLGLLMVTFGAIFSGVIVGWGRRIAGRMQSRIGPNRAGIFYVTSVTALVVVGILLSGWSSNSK